MVLHIPTMQIKYLKFLQQNHQKLDSIIINNITTNFILRNLNLII